MADSSNQDPDLRGAAVRGVLWTYAAVATSKLLALGSTVALARILMREEFGIAIYALTVCALFEFVRGLGVGQALIYLRRSEERTQTAFWLTAIAGFAFGGLMWGLGPVAADFFRDPRAEGVTRALAPYFPIVGLGLVLDSLLRKELRFGRRFLPELARALSKTVVSIALALLGWGYWSLIVGHLAGAAALTLTLWAVVPWRPRLVFDRGEALALLGYGKDMVVIAILATVAYRADHLIVGRYLGPAALGAYAVAVRFPELLVAHTSSMISSVLFPAYAKVESARQRLGELAIESLRIIAAAFVPVAVGLALVAEPLVLGTFGEEWSEAIPLLPWIALYCLLPALTRHLGDALKALGHTRVLVGLSALSATIVLLGMLVVAKSGGGLVEIAAVLAGGALLRSALDLWVARHLLGVRFRAAFGALAPVALSAASMAAVVLFVGRWTGGLGDLGELVALSVVGSVAYIASSLLFQRRVVDDVLGLMRQAISRDGRG